MHACIGVFYIYIYVCVFIKEKNPLYTDFHLLNAFLEHPDFLLLDILLIAEINKLTYTLSGEYS